ncbi:hypothetical protein Aph01nite_18870 [Acrocarpospora phusangensis]|uniref:K+ potassium transporter C-terminal domain-containing protein n=1 Tax=Acrocarpospora phusangensis TaxID=1070424 RepID=A0A919QC28_9ACTN|nr:KUP/HAK/KT family potassium transporter [Acrocarpospora phusangensis]GIH23577.1 hypothetical protein Aph01nite_18870 [Acrocarpospora phusangensis]
MTTSQPFAPSSVGTAWKELFLLAARDLVTPGAYEPGDRLALLAGALAEDEPWMRAFLGWTREQHALRSFGLAVTLEFVAARLTAKLTTAADARRMIDAAMVQADEPGLLQSAFAGLRDELPGRELRHRLLRPGRHRARGHRCRGALLNRGKQTAPLAMRANVEHNHVRHDNVIIMSIETEPVPRVPAGERITVDDLGYADDGIIHVTARFGYMETPDVPGALAALDPVKAEGRSQLDQASYFLSKIELRRGTAPTMAPWRKRLFIATSHITADAAEYFGLPRDRTVIMGSHIEV